MPKPLRHTLKPMFLSMFLAFSPAQASDLDKELRWSEQIVDMLLVGEAKTLKADGTDFLALYAEAGEGPGDRAAIILHGMGAHPNWPEVIQPLRSELPDHGWATLSLQMPILANEATLKDYVAILGEAPPRIQAGIGFLKEQGMETIVIIAHSLGSAMGCSFLVEPGSGDIDAFVGIGMPLASLDPRLDTAACLEKIQVPVLDLYGSRDRDVQATAEARRRGARKGDNEQYRQMEIEGADHFFNGMSADLVRIVRGWLYATFDKEKEGG